MHYPKPVDQATFKMDATTTVLWIVPLQIYMYVPESSKGN